MQRSWQAFHDDAKVNLLLNDKFLRNAGKRLSEVARIVIRGTLQGGLYAFGTARGKTRKLSRTGV
jgi:hypothetical protein